MFQNTFLSKEQIIKAVTDGLSDYCETHPELKGFIEHISVASKDLWGITGGGVRDFVFGYTPNDIDIVIDLPDTALQSLLTNYKFGKKNKFGGTKIILDNQLVDVWALEKTWGIREGHIPNKGLESYPQACAFNTDAAIILPTKQDAYVDFMIQSFTTGIIDVILDINPIPVQTVIKAYRLKHKYSLNFSEKTKAFITRSLSQQ